MDFMDVDGVRHIFTMANYIKHSKKHPELKESGFKNHIINSINNPFEVYPDFGVKGRYCYYYKILDLQNLTLYAKVVVAIAGRQRAIVTAWRTTQIKEFKYSLPCQKP